MILDNYNQQRIACEILECIDLEKNLLLIEKLKPKLLIDGNQYCYIVGELPEAAIAGFGDSPYLAMIDFAKDFYKKLND